jgi:hypothetical protein
MRALALVLVAAACGGGASVSSPGTLGGTGGSTTSTSDHNISTHEAFPADDDALAPSYWRAELDSAIAAEHAALDAAVQQLAGLDADARPDDALRIALADRDVRQRFLAALETCRADKHRCPPRLDDRPFRYELDGGKDPKLDTKLRFDLEDWRAVTAELHERACACRTVACIDAVDAATNTLEARPMPQVLADDTATESLTRARTCLMRLRGRRS